MRKRPLSTLLIVLLLVGVALVGIRRAEGPPVPEGFAVLRSSGELERVAFRLDESTRIVVNATGSVGDDEQLEAYPWMIDTATRKPVWRFSTGRARHAQGTLYRQRDTLDLAPGTYELYYTPFGRVEGGTGSRIFDRRMKWKNDRSEWFVSLNSLSGTWPELLNENNLPRPDGLVWRSTDERSNEAEGVFEVTSPAVVRVQFVGADIGARTAGRIERLSDGTQLWEAQRSQAKPAGGAPRNQRIEADVRLEPGLYRVVSRQTVGGLAREWKANPPEDPRSWGLSLFSRSGTVRPFTLWEGRTPFIRLRGDEPDAEKTARFRVREEATVVAYGMGEFASDADDYGWLENEATNERIWEQRRSATQPAGGAGKNRQSQQVLTLAPGVYRLHFNTDGSHHLGDFNEDAPEHEERYGAALFLLGPENALERLPVVAGDVPDDATVSNDTTAGVGPPPPPAPPEPPSLVAVTRGGVPAPPSVDGALAALVQVESNERRTARFMLRGDGAVRVYATGEFSGGGDLDTAWITNRQGETVWRMSEARLRHAGGSDRNRYCDEVVRLPAGAYVVHYTTDGGHAYGDFNNGPPVYEEAWGVIVTRADR